MDGGEDFIMLSAFVLMGMGLYLNKIRQRRWAIRPINRSPMESKAQYKYFEAMAVTDPEEFFRYTRMTVGTFNKLLEKITIAIAGKTRRAVPAKMKLALTLQYLTQGTTKKKEAWAFEIGERTAIKIIDEVVQAIISALMPEMLPMPDQDSWLSIARGFEERWNVPNMVGAVDGKHITVEKPWNSGSHNLNYKKTFSIILMAIVDADYRFRVVGVGSYGSEHDAGAFRATTFGQQLLDGNVEALKLPPPRCIAGMESPLPYFIVGDDAFPLKENLMKPYGGRGLSEMLDIFNYRISRGRRVVESAFGILAARFRIFKTHIIADPDRVEKYVLCAVILHNFILQEDGSSHYIPNGYADGEDADGNIVLGAYRQELNGGGFQGIVGYARNFRQTAGQVRDNLARWFVSCHGYLEWQWRIVKKPK